MNTLTRHQNFLFWELLRLHESTLILWPSYFEPKILRRLETQVNEHENF